MRALRGAITCDEDTQAEVQTKTQRLILEMLARNGIEHDDIVSVIFTATDDLHSEFPAAAARSLGLGDIPLLCAQELNIEGGMARVIRVLMHCYIDRELADVQHVYLDGAVALRTDIAQ